MNVAVLFNSDHPTLGGWYGRSVMHRILRTGVLQSTKRHMRVCLGDIPTLSAVASSSKPTVDALVAFCERVYRPAGYDRLVHARLIATHARATVYCWLFQAMTLDVADRLDAHLRRDPSYLGSMGVDFADPVHLAMFRNSLIESYRINGVKWSLFYSMGENEDPDEGLRQEIESFGFSVAYEDIGARRSVFDNYDSLDHFRRVRTFLRTFSSFEGSSQEHASNIALLAEELHPKLFDGLAAAARALDRAETEEDLAQAALSGRRLLETIAGYLFPPRDEAWKGRSVGAAQYRNRLWAYIDGAIEAEGGRDEALLEPLGRELDSLVDLFNSGLHGDPDRTSTESAFVRLMQWLVAVIELSPMQARKPYEAYADEILKLARVVAYEDESEPRPNTSI